MICTCFCFENYPNKVWVLSESKFEGYWWRGYRNFVQRRLCTFVLCAYQRADYHHGTINIKHTIPTFESVKIEDVRFVNGCLINYPSSIYLVTRSKSHTYNYWSSFARILLVLSNSKSTESKVWLWSSSINPINQSCPSKLTTKVCYNCENV